MAPAAPHDNPPGVDLDCHDSSLAALRPHDVELERELKKPSSATGPLSTARTQNGWQIRASQAALRTVNPIRKIIDALKPDSHSTKEIISLGQGDPTVYGHLKAPDCMVEAVVAAAQSGSANGYMHSYGHWGARRALADLYSRILCHPVDPEADVILTAGCNSAIDLSLQSLCNPGDNVLIPRPGYPLYETFLSYMGVEARHYDLLPERDWEVDLQQLEQMADERTAVIIVCNPGNPSGCVYRREHLKEILGTAEKLHLPIIADEVYGGITFRGVECTALGSLGGPVPVITVCSLSKKYLVPGWRIGWIVITDRAGVLAKAQAVEALRRQMQFTAAPSSILQVALPRILEETPADFFADVNRDLEAAAELCCQRAEEIAGIDCPSKPQGSMFVMIRIDPAAYRDIRDDVQWCAELLKEESLVVIPGTAFNLPNYARCVFALPLPVLREAWDRIEAFCKRHVVA